MPCPPGVSSVRSNRNASTPSATGSRPRLPAPARVVSSVRSTGNRSVGPDPDGPPSGSGRSTRSTPADRLYTIRWAMSPARATAPYRASSSGRSDTDATRAPPLPARVVRSFRYTGISAGRIDGGTDSDTAAGSALPLGGSNPIGHGMARSG